MSKILTPADWDLNRAMARLGVRQVPYDGITHPNVRGYSLFDELAISPQCKEVKFVAIHELAHIHLGHARTTEKMIKELVGSDLLPKLDHVSDVDAFLNRESTIEELRAMRKYLMMEDQIERDLEQVKSDHEIEAHFIALGLAHKLNFTWREYDSFEETRYIAEHGGGYDRVQAHVGIHRERLVAAGLEILSAGL